jgi:hypothetical protein
MGNLHRCNQEDYSIYKSLDSGKEVCAIFLDVSKDFDKVWYKGLIFKLRLFGITDTLISLLENYLTDRSQRLVQSAKLHPVNLYHLGFLEVQPPPLLYLIMLTT